MASHASPYIRARFIEQADGKYLVKTQGGAQFEFMAEDFKSAMAQLVMEIGLLKKAHALPVDFDVATQVKIDVA